MWMSLCNGDTKHLVSHRVQIPQVTEQELQETRDNYIWLFWLRSSRVKATVQNSILTKMSPSLEGSTVFTTSSTGHQRWLKYTAKTAKTKTGEHVTHKYKVGSEFFPQAASDLLLPPADSSLFCCETAEQQLCFNFTSTSLDIQFSVLHEASSEGNFSQELMWLWCDSLCSIWLKHFLHNSKFSSRIGLSGIWDRGATWIKVTVFKFLSNYPLPTHIYCIYVSAHICTHASQP